MKKYLLILAIVVVGCKWRYDKVIAPEERAWGYTIMAVYKNSTDTFYQLNRKPFTWDEADARAKEDMQSPNCVMSRPIEWDSVYDVVMRGTESRKKETINAIQIWPAYTGATIHMHNNLDSGKGYIFRKYQNKLPKKHIIIDLSSGVK